MNKKTFHIFSVIVFVTIVIFSFIYLKSYKTKAQDVGFTKDKTIPEIIFATETSAFYPGDFIDVYFNTSINTSKSSFDLPENGTGIWLNKRHFRYKPIGIKAGDILTYKPISIVAENGQVYNGQDYYQIVVPSVVTAEISPIISSPNVTKIKIAFNQHIDHESAEKLFSVSPYVAGKIEWQDDNMIWTKTGGENYSNIVLNLEKGIKGETGFSSNKSFSYNIKSKIASHLLNVPFFKQQYSRSCEAASLRMALAYLGINTDDKTIVDKMGYTPKVWDRINNIWDDPEQQFVGFLDGSQIGYGAYSETVAKSANTFGINATSYKGIDARFLAEQIYQNKPVVIWGYFTPFPKSIISWNTESGKTIQGYNGEHARVVVGVLGTSENPIGFYVHDPLYEGPDVYWSKEKLMTHMNTFGNISNQAVVVFR